jgi:hypothetical protein
MNAGGLAHPTVVVVGAESGLSSLAPQKTEKLTFRCAKIAVLSCLLLRRLKSNNPAVLGRLMQLEQTA